MLKERGFGSTITPVADRGAGQKQFIALEIISTCGFVNTIRDGVDKN
jgi:hypothetical protein